MVGRAIAVGVVVMLVAAFSAVVGADAPDGPRLAMVRWDGTPSIDLIDTDDAGRARATLIEGDLRHLPAPYPYDVPSWSSDGSTLAFTAMTGPRRTWSDLRAKIFVEPRTKIFVASADGSEVRPVPGTRNGASPVFAPDGHTIAFMSRRTRRRKDKIEGDWEVTYESAAIMLVDLVSNSKRRLTPWRDGLHAAPSSFSPDGTRLAASRRVEGSATEAVELQLDSGEVRVLAHHAQDPVYSPDGSQLALLREGKRTSLDPDGEVTARFSDLFTMRSDGSEQRRLTNTPRAAEFAPRWDPSGERLAFTRLPDFLTETGLFGFGDVIVEVNADGSCPTNVLSAPRALYFGATWQPGPGREAGRIAC